MVNSFLIEIDGVSIKINAINVRLYNLFDVYLEGRQWPYQIREEAPDHFLFVLKERLPQKYWTLQPKISEVIVLKRREE